MNDPQPSFNPTHVRNRTLALVLVLMLLASALAARFLLIQQERFHLETINDRRKTAEAILSAMSAELKERYQARIISFANSKPEIFRAFADRDRERLLELVTPYYRHMHRENPYFTQISFVTPDRKAFLRTTLPRLFGDDASDISPLMVEAITRRETMAGFEAGFIEPVLRVIQPVFAHNEFQGVFCFSIKAQQLVDMAHRALGLSAILAEPKGSPAARCPRATAFPARPTTSTFTTIPRLFSGTMPDSSRWMTR